jgi:hypothetical protein
MVMIEVFAASQECELVERRKIKRLPPAEIIRIKRRRHKRFRRAGYMTDRKIGSIVIFCNASILLSENGRPQRFAGFDYTGLPDNSNELLPPSTVLPPSWRDRSRTS